MNELTPLTLEDRLLLLELQVTLMRDLLLVEGPLVIERYLNSGDPKQIAEGLRLNEVLRDYVKSSNMKS